MRVDPSHRVCGVFLSRDLKTVALDIEQLQNGLRAARLCSVEMSVFILRNSVVPFRRIICV